MSGDKKPLKIALHGFDARGSKTLVMYLAMYCKNIAEVVTNPEAAEADVFDFDIKVSKTLFESHLQTNLSRPVIVFSLSEHSGEAVFHIKKPVNADNMMQILVKAKTLARNFPKPVIPEAANTIQTPKKYSEKPKTETQVTEIIKNDVSGSALKSDKPKIAAKVLPDVVHKEPKRTETVNKQTRTAEPEAESIMQSLDDWFDL